MPLLGNLPPSLAVIVISVGLVERDGVVVTTGLALSVVALLFAAAVNVAAAFAVIELLRQAIG